MLVLSLIISQPLAAEPFAELFGYPGQIQGTIDDFPKWALVIEDYNRAGNASQCADSSDCAIADWQDMLHDLRGVNAQKQLKVINAFVNRQAYVDDATNYGELDFWAAPEQFLANGGDCEDFAILKMLSLLQLGWSSSALRIVVVQDTDLKMPHAVLAVSVGADVWVLDNQNSSLTDAHDISNYAPVYALSNRDWWLYAPAEKSIQASLPASR